MPLTDDEMRELLGKVRALHAAMMQRRAERPPAGKVVERIAHPPRATSGDIEDPVVRFDPKRGYTGPSMVGRRFSECAPLYLGQLSHLYDWRAGKNRDDGKDDYAASDEKMAALCRAWRERKEGPKGTNAELPLSTPPAKARGLHEPDPNDEAF